MRYYTVNDFVNWLVAVRDLSKYIQKIIVTLNLSHHVALVPRIITGSYVTTTRKPQFSEEDPWSRV